MLCTYTIYVALMYVMYMYTTFVDACGHINIAAHKYMSQRCVHCLLYNMGKRTAQQPWPSSLIFNFLDHDFSLAQQNNSGHYT